MKTLVLGGSGFVGSWLVHELLERNVQVVVVSRSPAGNTDMAHPGVEYVCGDFNDGSLIRKALAGCSIAIHAGGYYPVFSGHRVQQGRHAIRELRSVLAACFESGVRRFIFTSSPMVLVKDNAAFRISTYHYIKRLIHDEVVDWIGKGIPGVLVIPGACFGPGDRKPTTGRVILEIARRRPKFMLEGKMNAVDVRDVAKAYMSILDKAAIGSCYQLGNWNCTFSEFAGLVASIAGVSPPRLSLPYPPVNRIALVAEWIQLHAGARRPVLPDAGLNQIHFGTHLDSAAAIRDFGFDVRPIEVTIRETIEYFLQNGYFTKGQSRRVHGYGMEGVARTSTPFQRCVRSFRNRSVPREVSAPFLQQKGD
ncbi:MAG: NAD-dependent epimerase/dehydratase family protein [Bacteroidota bacterium]|jgi:dihydroflavonol-4-reductase